MAWHDMLPRILLVGVGMTCLQPAAGAPSADCSAARHDDWLVRAPVLARRIAPEDCATLIHTPPVFAWPHQGRGARYEVSVRLPSGTSKTHASASNALIWPEPLPPGQYSWSVSVRRADGSSSVGDARRFRIEAGASVLRIPQTKQMHEKAQATARPRSFPSGAEGDALLDTLANARREGFQRLLARAAGLGAEPLPPEPPVRADRIADYDARSLAQLEIQRAVSAQERRLFEVALAWRATGRDEFWRDLRRRALHLAAWDPRGSSGLASQDQSTRSIAWSLAIVLDWGYAHFSTAERAAILASLRVRVGDLVADVLGDPPRIALMPHDSHRAHTLGRLAALSLLLAGEVPEAAEWVAVAVPAYLAVLSPWGGADGGYANGTSYANWDIGESLFAWDIIRRTAGIDIAAMTWPRNFLRYLAYFLPPGTPAGAFGDGAEVARGAEWSHYARLYAARMKGETPEWYARQQFGADESAFPILLAQPSTPLAVSAQPGLPDAAVFPSIGWAAMHSRLSDRARISVYFKSSPYGSFNHGHADQNSFVVNAFGRALAIDSGYYDYYGSPHWKSWYKQTAAHNAITFDGGRGQALGKNGLGDMAARGEIVQFRHTPEYDMTTGDATAAYGGALTQAIRSIVYVRPGIILVFDALASETPRSWEWNIHGLNRFEHAGPGRIVLRNREASLCVDAHASLPLAFSQSDRFPQAPAMKAWTNQWHGAFVTSQKSTRQAFAVAMRVNCASTDIDLKAGPGGAWKAKVGNLLVTFDGNRVEIE